MEGSQDKELNLLVPADCAGVVLGKGGSTLKDVRDRFGCKVKMHKDKLPYSEERVLEIPGKETQVDCFTVKISTELFTVAQVSVSGNC